MVADWTYADVERFRLGIVRCMGEATGLERAAVEKAYPVTPDGRYFVVRGRLWRCSNPGLEDAVRERLVKELMVARSAKGKAMRAGDEAAREVARKRVDEVKHALGERGEVWWTDGSPDLNRKMVKSTVYAHWFAGLA